MSGRRKKPTAGRKAIHDQVMALSDEERTKLLMGLSLAERREWDQRWSAWALDGQKEPPGDWRVWLVRAGRGFGKTRTGAEWVSEYARRNPGARIALVGDTVDDVRAVMIEGKSGLFAVARSDEEPRWREGTGEIAFSSGAVATVFSARAPEKLRGPEHNAAWCDEVAKWRWGDVAWDNLIMGLRLGERPRAIVTTTPRPNNLMRRIMAMRGVVQTVGRTDDNPHLPDAFTDAVRDQYGGTRLGRQELDGEMVDDVEGALWSRELIERARTDAVPKLARVVVGVDPPASADGDACGIVAVGLGRDGCAYVLEDASVRGLPPEGWARAVAQCAARVGADRVVAESNQGGEMVEHVLRAADETLPVKLVHASRGKGARAEPVQLLYEKGRVRHAGAFPELEDELAGMKAAGGYAGPGRSPDRADALVWAVWALTMERKAEAGVRFF